MKRTLIFLLLLLLIGCDAIPTPLEMQNPVWVQITEGLNFPEGPAWDSENTLCFSNCYGHWIGRLRDGKVDTFSLVDSSSIWKSTNGLAVGPDRKLYACDFEKGQIVRFDSQGRAEIYLDGYRGQRLNRPNDLCFDNDGNLYFTDPQQYDRTNPDGFVYRLSANDRTVTIAADQIAFPNGILMHPDGRSVYVCESAAERILKFRIDEEGRLVDRKVYLELPGGDPDGLAMDRAGNLYVAHFGGAAVYIVSPAGEILKKIPTPGHKPTNITFGGTRGKILYLTEVETNALYYLTAQKRN